MSKELALFIAQGLLWLAKTVLPTVGSLLGGPLGMIAGWLASKLIAMLETTAHFSLIDAQIEGQVADVKDALTNLKEAQVIDDPIAKEKRLEEFKAACAKLTHISV